MIIFHSSIKADASNHQRTRKTQSRYSEILWQCGTSQVFNVDTKDGVQIVIIKIATIKGNSLQKHAHFNEDG